MLSCLSPFDGCIALRDAMSSPTPGKAATLPLLQVSSIQPFDFMAGQFAKHPLSSERSGFLKLTHYPSFAVVAWPGPAVI
jgi:hypothetical protein